jgi:hypothetical protein
LNDEVRVEDDVHLHEDVRYDVGDGCVVEEPTEEVDGTGEEAEDAAPFETRSYGGVVVDTTSGRDCGGELVREAC